MTKIEQTKYETLEPGTYRAKVGAVSVEPGQFGEQVKVKFELLEEDYPDKSLIAWASAKLSPKSKLFGWVSVLLFGGRPVPEDFDLETDQLLGRECLLLVELQTKEGQEFNRVKELLPIRRNGKQAAPVPTQLQPRQPAASLLATTPTTERDEPPVWVAGADEELPF